MRVLSVGLIVSDIMVYPVDKTCFDRSVTLIKPVKFSPGGDAFNVAVNLARLGAHSSLCGLVGNDPAGEFMINEAKRAGIDIDGIYKNESGSTATSVILCEESGEHRFLFNGQSAEELSISHIDREVFDRSDIVFIGGAMDLKTFDGDEASQFFKSAKEKGKITAMDTSWDSENKWIKKIEKTLLYTDYFIPSFDEAVKITGTDDLAEMKVFMSAYPLKCFGVKLGGDGCFLTDFKNDYHIPVIPVEKVIDTTGAGDSFMAGFLYGLTQGCGIYSSGLFATAVANFCIRQLGTTSGTPDASAVINFINNKIDDGEIKPIEPLMF